MNTISNINPRSPIKTETRAVELAGSCSSTFATSQNKDLADISQNWKQQVDWQVQTTTIIDQLQKSFPDIQIFYSGTMNKQELAQLAASLGKGSYLIVSEEFLTQMGSSEENFEAGKAAILNALNQLSSQSGQPGKGAYLLAQEKLTWSLNQGQKETSPKMPWQQEAEDAKRLLDRMKEMQEEIKEKQQKQKELRKKMNQANYRTAGTYAQLASANSKAQVQWVMGDARRKIAKLRMSCSLNDTDEQMKTRAAIRSYQNLLVRGGRKVRRLNEEELTRLRQKRAEKQEQNDEALRLKMEMKKQRLKRKSADNMIAEEGRLHDLNQAVYSPHRRGKYRFSPEDHIPTSSIAVPSGAEPAFSAGPIAQGGFTPADVTITSEPL